LRPSLSSASGVIVRSATLWPATASPSSSTMPATPAPPEALVVKIESAGGRAVAAQADIANPAAVARLFDTAEAAYGGVDGVVNNAGIMQLATIAESDDAVFDRQIAINLKGVFNTLREASRRLPRMGRKNRLGARQRERLWQVFGAVLAELKAKSFQTDASIFTEAAELYAERSPKPFDHIIVDEAQDLGVPELRFLTAIAPDRPDALFFAGDIGQRIFQQPFSWKGLGIDVRGRSVTLKVNYRTSHQIRVAADRLLPRSVRDVDGFEDERAGTISVFDGPEPEVLLAKDLAAEGAAAAAFLKAVLGAGIAPTEIGIFVRSEAELPRAKAAADTADLLTRSIAERARPDAALIGTMYLAKGLEFRAVLVMACDEGVIPSTARIADVADEFELDEVMATERQLLYVALTRARDRAFVSGVEPGSEFLEDLRL
jgi:superfamily I DNA/RNA helicase